LVIQNQRVHLDLRLADGFLLWTIMMWWFGLADHLATLGLLS